MLKLPFVIKSWLEFKELRLFEKAGYYIANALHRIISLRDSSTKKTIYANPLLLYFLQIMIPKNIKAIQFLKTLLLENDPTEIQKNIFFFPSKTIGFFSGFPSKSVLKKYPQGTLWITSNKWFFRKNLSSLHFLFFLKKEKDTYSLHDRRYLKLIKGIHLLPPVAVTLISFNKTAFLIQKENELFFPSRASSFYYQGDTTSRLKNPSYLQRLETLQKEKKLPLKIWEKTFLFLKEKLDT